MNSIIDFYSDPTFSYGGPSLMDILSYSDRKFETSHTHIQILFPTREPSKYNPRATLLTDEVVNAFADSKVLRSNFALSIARFRTFLDLDREITKDSYKPHWLTPMNHNHLRITRALHSIRELHPFHLNSFYHDLMNTIELDDEYSISETTLKFWLGALLGKDPGEV